MIDRCPGGRPATPRPVAPARGVLASLILAFALMAADGPPGPSAPPRAEVAPPSGAALLEKAWPGHPEWLAMLVDIVVVGDRMGGNDGWFRKAVTQTRFDWKATRSALDKDGDGSIARAEFSGSDADFARLDRDRDGTLTAVDFDFTPQAAPPGLSLFGRADRDGNGKITREEFESVFRAMDSGGLGFLSRDDIQQALAPPPRIARSRTGGADARDVPQELRPAGTRRVPARSFPGRHRARLHAHDRGWQGGDHPLEADRAEADRAGLR